MYLFDGIEWVYNILMQVIIMKNISVVTGREFIFIIEMQICDFVGGGGGVTSLQV